MIDNIWFNNENEIRIAEILMTLADAEVISQGRAAELWGDDLETWRKRANYLHQKRIESYSRIMVVEDS